MKNEKLGILGTEHLIFVDKSDARSDKDVTVKK